MLRLQDVIQSIAQAPYGQNVTELTNALMQYHAPDQSTSNIVKNAATARWLTLENSVAECSLHKMDCVNELIDEIDDDTNHVSHEAYAYLSALDDEITTIEDGAHYVLSNIDGTEVSWYVITEALPEGISERRVLTTATAVELITEDNTILKLDNTGDDLNPEWISSYINTSSIACYDGLKASFDNFYDNSLNTANSYACYKDLLGSANVDGNIPVDRARAILDQYGSSEGVNYIRETLSEYDELSSTGVSGLIMQAINAGKGSRSTDDPGYTPLQTPRYCSDVIGAVIAAVVAIIATVLSAIFTAIGAILLAVISVIRWLFDNVFNKLDLTSCQLKRITETPLWNWPGDTMTLRASQLFRTDVVDDDLHQLNDTSKALWLELQSGGGAVLYPTEMWNHQIPTYAIAVYPSDPIRTGDIRATNLQIQMLWPGLINSPISGSFEETMSGVVNLDASDPNNHRLRIGPGLATPMHSLCWRTELDAFQSSYAEDWKKYKSIVSNIIGCAQSFITGGGTDFNYYATIPWDSYVADFYNCSDTSFDEVADNVWYVYTHSQYRTSDPMDISRNLLTLYVYELGKVFKNKETANPYDYDSDDAACLLQDKTLQILLLEMFCEDPTPLLVGINSEVVSITEAVKPALEFPNISRSSLITTVVISALTAAAIYAGKTIVGKAMKSRALKKNALAQQKYDAAVKAYQTEPTKANQKALYKANRKLTKSWTRAKNSGLTMINGFDTGAGGSSLASDSYSTLGMLTEVSPIDEATHVNTDDIKILIAGS